MSRRDGPYRASRYSSFSRDNLRSDDTLYEYYKSYNNYAHSRRTPSLPRQSGDAKKAKDVKHANTRSQSRDNPSSYADESYPRTFNNTGYPRPDSSDESSEFGEIPQRPASRGQDRPSGAAAATTANTAPTISSVKSPRAALNRFNTNIRRSPTPKSPDLSHHYTAPRGRPPLPPGWAPQFSTTHNRWFYYNRTTGKSQWEAPGFEEKTPRSILRNKADGGGRIRTDAEDSDGDGDDVGTGRGRGRGRGLGDSGRRRCSGGDGGKYAYTYSHDYDHGYDDDYKQDTRYAEPRRKHSSLGSGLGTAGMILGVAGGIAAGTLLARALQSKQSRISMTESAVRRKKSQSSFTD